MRCLVSIVSFLSVVLMVDALLSIVFGLVSYLSPESTYATIVDLSELSEHSLMSAVLDSLSIFYVVVGAVCLLAAFMPHPYNVRVAVVMIAQHVWIGAKGLIELGRPWLVGNPWPDIIIHSLFVITYIIAIMWSVRRSSSFLSQP